MKPSFPAAKLLFISLVACSAYADETQLTDNTPRLTALTHAKLMLSPGKQLDNATLLIENNRIKQVISNNEIPQNAYKIDLNGYTIYPGFIDPFAEYGLEYSESQATIEGPVYRINPKGAVAANGAIHAEKEWFSYVLADKEAASNWISNGFTSVQSAHLNGIFRGVGVSLSLADKNSNQLIYSPKSRHFIAFDKGNSPQDYPNSLMGSIALIRQTLSDANWYNQNKMKAAGREDLLSPEFNIALERLHDIKTRGAIFDTRNLNNQLRAAKLLSQEDIQPILLGNGQEYARVRELQEYRPVLILPLNFPAAPQVSDEDNAREVPLRTLRHWERAPSNPAVMAANNIPFSFTQYGMDGKAFWPRLRMALQAGLDEETALAALTTEAAAAAGIDNLVGKLAPGYMADLVIAKGNLFQDGEIVSVWLQGEEQKQLAPEFQWQGSYRLHLAELELDLELQLTQQTPRKLRGNLSSGDQQIALAHLKADSKRLSFSVNLQGAGINGISRLTLWQDDEGLRGRLLSADGAVTQLAGSRLPHAPLMPETEEDTRTNTQATSPKTVSKTGPKTEPEYLSRLTSPLQAYGRSELPGTEKLHIRNVTLWTSSEAGIIGNSDLLMADGKIEKIGTDLSTPASYQVIEGADMHLTAGIIDEHSHIAVNGGLNEMSDAITSEVRIADVLNPDDIAIYRSLAGGVTTANLLHGSANPIGGQSQVIQLRWGESAEGLKFAQAHQGIKFALGENVKQSNWGERYTRRFPQSRMGVKALMSDAFNAARDYKDAQAQYAELRSREKRKQLSPRPDYRLQAIAQVLNGERDVHIHSYVQSEILMFLRLAEAYDFKVTAFTHVLEGYKLAPELAALGAGASTFADWWAYKFEVYDAIPQNACLMMNAGVLTSINSDDYEMQRRLNQEAAKSVKYCDMSQEDAWKMVTINPAKQLGIDAITGSVEEGKPADLVLWDANPLSVYAKSQAVWIGGKRYFDRAEDKQMTQAIASERQALIQKILGSDPARRQGETTSEITEPLWQCDTQFNAWGQNKESRL
ncbi:amidohydrolase [Shewanella algae]|uniref:amidohydrolase family protein n=1 Tax=Shewanella algae TaxID=38313 RepID=UPI0011830C54|nr:amidohydrolase family protein [Shewanella algae]QXP31421.1 amidohydrolase family protein [Shewanella algae]QXP35321.1 amidohydrolase family protein [Shewanella algae]TVL05687.1 amidohydrolase [Shewanella algae]UYA15650.1 amidohydrolase [Shewanella algae]